MKEEDFLAKYPTTKVLQTIFYCNLIIPFQFSVLTYSSIINQSDFIAAQSKVTV